MLITDFDSGCCPSSEVATIETLNLPPREGSIMQPLINSTSGSTSDVIFLTTSSTSKSVKSLPPVIFINKPLHPLKNSHQLKDCL